MNVLDEGRHDFIKKHLSFKCSEGSKGYQLIKEVYWHAMHLFKYGLIWSFDWNQWNETWLDSRGLTSDLKGGILRVKLGT